MAKFCAGCGAALKEGARFCEKCGQMVALEQTAIPVANAAIQPAEPVVAATMQAPERMSATAVGRLSADGKWRWDGRQWVAVQATMKARTVVGQLSADGSWRWNGREWKDATKAHTQYFEDGSRQMVDAQGKKSGWRMTPAQSYVYGGFILLVAVPVFIFIIYKIFTVN